MINLDRLDKKINESRNVMSGSWTTTGMKKAMKILFEGISHTMDESTKQTELTNRLVTSIYKRFQSENEEMNISPKLFSIISYRQEIEALYQDAEEYRTGMYSTMTEQSFVIKKFFISMVSRARNIYYQLNKDANDWSKRALTPLVRQVKSHKNEIQLRMGQLKKAGQSRDSITHRVDEIKFEAVSLQKQIGTINKMMTLINTPMPTIVHSNKANKKAGTIKKKVASVKKKIAPVKKKIAPVKKKIAPVKKKVAPVKKKIASVKKKVAPVKKKVASVKKKAVQAKHSTVK